MSLIEGVTMDRSRKKARDDEDDLTLERDLPNGSERKIVLHPLAIINMAEHTTRVHMAQEGQRTSTASTVVEEGTFSIPCGPVLGVFFGRQKGLEVTICDSFELVYTRDDQNVIQIDVAYLKARKEQFATVFPTFELLGWYAVKEKVEAEDLKIHRTMMELNESPLFLLLKRDIPNDSKNLPVSLYESELHVLNDTPRMIFVSTPFKVETLEAERIALDHVANVTPSSNGDDKFSPLYIQLESIRNAVRMLYERINTLYDYLQETKNGTVPSDHRLLRQISSICNQIPVMSSNDFNEHFLQEYNDSMLVTYLATVTKGMNTTNEIIDKFLVSYDRGNRNASSL